VSKTKAKVRADQLLVERGLAPSRARAQALIMAGDVLAGTQRIDKPGHLLASDVALSVRDAAHTFVSRGGVKLEGALHDFKLDVAGLRAIDVGASTGGFTDCLLQRGARHVIAVDVGYGQLAQKLRSDDRVTVMERCNARELTADAVGGVVDLVVVDASFISLTKLLDAIAGLLRPAGHLVALIKPQFEVGKEVAKRAAGVIRDDTARSSAIQEVLAAVDRQGFRVLAHVDCVIPGPKGNREAFVHAQRCDS
jgi:23S rRNA (cytidine1920-2'-O)/16S rRNA (cytidine1409-2'-O)-methyltransferase